MAPDPGGKVRPQPLHDSHARMAPTDESPKNGKPSSTTSENVASDRIETDHQGHDHDHEEEIEAASAEQWAEMLAAARRGLKSDVQRFMQMLPEGLVYIPLSEDLPNAEIGETTEWDGELTFRPHMLRNSDESIFAVAYSDPELVEPVAQALKWQTSEGELKFICVPSHVAFDLSQLEIDAEAVAGLVFNPGTDQELVLQRDEAASLGQGVAIPLVGYVADLPAGEYEESHVVQGAEPPPAALLDALAEARQDQRDVVAATVETTFNPERDREPHLTIYLTVISHDGLDRQKLADELMEGVAPHLPAPGYADIVFLDAPN